MKHIVFSFALIALSFISLEGISQNKQVISTASSDVDVNENSKASENSEIKTAEKPNVNAVDINNGIPNRTKVIERTPEMLERKKTAPLLNEPQ